MDTSLSREHLSLERIRFVLLRESGVVDCALTTRRTQENEERLIAYVVSTEEGDEARWRKRIREAVSEDTVPDYFVPLAAIPLTEDGEVDEAILAEIPVLDGKTMARCEADFRRECEGEDFAVVSVAFAKTPEALHLSDLLGDCPGFRRDEKAAQGAENRAGGIVEPAGDGARLPAVSHGPVLEVRSGDPQTLPETLRRAAKKRPDRGVVFLDEDGTDMEEGYEGLCERASSFLGGLRERGLKPGDAVILQLKQGREMLAAFWGCVVGGFVPVPIGVAPSYAEENAVVSKLAHAWDMLEHPAVIASRELVAAIAEAGRKGGREYRVWPYDEVGAAKRDEDWYEADKDEVAVLLLTSGSTGLPKAVPLSHWNLITMAAGTVQDARFTEKEVSLNWMPLDHVGSVSFLGCMCTLLGCRQIHCHTERILEAPLRWLDFIERFGATISWAPNFAYGLINERAAEIEAGRWDLSSMRFLCTAGEAVVAKTARRFLALLAGHGLSRKALVPAFGMSETCSGISWNQEFSLDETSDEDAFVSVGPPISGAAFRIVTEKGEVVPEGQVGLYQLKGPSLFSGYFKNPEANAEAFTEDGWLNTGDLGFLRKGCLTITGRQKDVIIINGLNYYSHEIEAVVEEIPGVVRSFTAACAVRPAGGDREELAVFFCPREPELARECMTEIRGRVLKKAGVNPAWILPLTKEDIPKTEIGKIQRPKLKESFESGAFAGAVRQADLWLRNENTLPNWFLRETWQRKKIRVREDADAEGKSVLIFEGDGGLGRALEGSLVSEGCRAAWVRAGERFAQTGEDRYEMRPDCAEDYEKLFTELKKTGFVADWVLHLWGYEQALSGSDPARRLRRARARGAESLAVLAREFSKVNVSEPQRIDWIVVTGDASEAGGLRGLLRTVAQEIPSVRARHVRFPVLAPEQDAARVWEECRSGDAEVEIAYRDGVRMVKRLEATGLGDAEGKRAAKVVPFKSGGLYLLTGGLGGIGQVLAEWLLREFDARLILTGRRDEHDAREALESLRLAGGEVDYRTVDVCDAAEIAEVVGGAEERWGRKLDGIVHLAGVYDERLLSEDTLDHFREIAAAKVEGTVAVCRLLEERPDALFLGFSSLASFFGGAETGAYTAGNDFLRDYCEVLRLRGFENVYCYQWGRWNETGMMRGYRRSAVGRARGVREMTPEQALYSLRGGLASGERELLIGLAPENPHIRHYLCGPERIGTRRMAVCYEGKSKPSADFEWKDPFGVRDKAEWIRVEEWPVDKTGKTDREALEVLARARLRGEAEWVAPRNEREEAIARIWEEVLGRKRFSVRDNFFELGGNSLKATQVVSRLRDAFGALVSQHLLFEFPTVEGLASRLEGDGESRQEEERIGRRTETGEAPVSFAQRRMWLLDQLSHESAAYNVASVHRIAGGLNPERLRKSLETLVSRHEGLRTDFPLVEGDPVQRIHEDCPMDWKETDLRNIPVSEREEKLKAALVKDAQEPFDLSKAPLLRVGLFHVEDEAWVFQLVVHHMVFDGWSLGVFFREVAALYEGDEPLPELELHYADFSQWQRAWLEGGAGERQLSYWKTQLARPLPVLELPTDRPRSNKPHFEGASHWFVAEKALWREVEAFSRQQGVTSATTLLSVFKVLLYRYTRQEDLLVGTPVANRNRREIEQVVGCFVNTLVIRDEARGDFSFVEFLGRVNRTFLEAQAHQDFPFERLVEALDPERDVSMNPVFQVMFVFQNFEGEALRLPGLEVEGMRLDTGRSKFDLLLELRETERGLEGRFEYSSELFERATVARVAEHFLNLMGAAVVNPESRIDRLPMLSEAERRKVVWEWNRTGREYPKDVLLHGLFEEQVERTPDAVAIEFEDRSLTYRELNEEANRFARFLRKRGVGAEKLVGVFVERSLEMMVGFLGILKAGGAYVPLDPGYPEERLGYMVEDSGVEWVVTLSGLAGELPGSKAEMLCLDTDAAQWEGLEAGNLTDREICSPGNLAYMIYTSGSTGRPKGAMNEHSGICNRLLWMQEYFSIGSEDRVVQKTPLSFDVSVWELFWPIMTGARLVIARPEGHRDARYLVDLCREKRITTMHFVPSMMRVFLEEEGVEALQWLRRVICSGEALPLSYQALFFERCPGELYNLYGPTEAAVDVTYWKCERGWRGNSVPIGRPIANTQIYVLDQKMQPVPEGVPGELHIGGVGVGRGYWGRGELTEEKFVPDPFCTRAESRLYKTGDLVRWLPDGNLEFLGRMDSQVKLRGLRIELGEIEEALIRAEGVKEAAVLVKERKGNSDDRYLSAYVVPEEGCGSGATELRAALSKSLPAYMVPSVFVFLESLPLTSNGKLDRKALPDPDGKADSGEAYVAPRTEVEEKLAALWSEVLGVERVGIRDNFFELGGHSLLATKVMYRLPQVLGIELSLGELFENRTIEQLAARIAGDAAGSVTEREASEETGIPRLSLSCRESAPLSFSQQRMWLLDGLTHEAAPYNSPVLIRIRGILDVEALRKSLDELTERQEGLRARFVMQEGELFQRIDPPCPVDLEIRDLTHLSPEEADAKAKQMVEDEAYIPFDLDKTPLYRMRLYRLSGEEAVLNITIHHIIYDGWSLDVIFEELRRSYPAFVAGRQPEAAPISVQYIDFAVWQREWIKGDAGARQLAYWKRQLGGELAPLEMFTDRPRPEVLTYRGMRHKRKLPAALGGRLNELSEKEGVTLFMTGLAAFNVLLLRYTRQEDLLVGTAIANRNRPQIEKLIGLFVNTLVMRTDLSGNPTFRELLRRVQKTALEAYANQDLPFDVLVDELDVDREPNRHPIFQVMFSVQNANRVREEIAGNVFEVDWPQSRRAKFDLLLEMVEDGGEILTEVEYMTDLFDEETILRFQEHFEVLLEEVARDPDIRILDIPLLSSAERENVLRDFNRTDTPYPADRSIHRLFEERVRKDADREALAYLDTSMSYGELNQRANQVARYLQKAGVERGTRVGFSMDRSPEMVVTLLGILKAGAVYVPLDPQYPETRLRFMIEDGELDIVITQEKLRSRFDDSQAQVITLEADGEEIAAEAVENLSIDGDGGDTAYVIYTSGSTGTPKGTEIPHRGVVRLLFGVDYVALDEEQTILHYSSITFDASTFEVWGALLHGGRCVLHPEPKPTLQGLKRSVEGGGVSVIFITTGLFNLIVDESLEMLRGVKWVLTGGEQVSVPHVRKALMGLPGTRLVHVYGPTETTTFATAYPIPRDLGEDEWTIPIGRPIGNTTAYVVDAKGEPVPGGVAGELWIGGAGLAKGYLNQPELTREKFVPDAFGASQRLYRTGDLVRILPEGQIQFLGRLDHQVKLRGFRIELGEIEAALRRHPGVKQSIVLINEGEAREKFLTGYFVPELSGVSKEVPSEEGSKEHVDTWQGLFDSLYLGKEGADDAFNLAGWNSSYTGKAIPSDQMKIWLENTVERIEAYEPKHVLEIGFGTGMLLLRIAPRAETFVGTEFSKTAIDYVRGVIDRNPERYGKVELLQRLGDNFSGLRPKSFDTVVINSVVQYFPSVDYLVDVLVKAARAVKSGGRILIGDVRNHRLLETFHTAVEQYQASPTVRLKDLELRIKKGMLTESELLVDPSLFYALKEVAPRISHVEIRYKRGEENNELNQFRYDAVVHVGGEDTAPAAVVKDWEEGFGFEELSKLLETEKPEAVLVTHIPNGRLSRPLRYQEMLNGEYDAETAGDLTGRVEAEERSGSLGGVHPERFWRMRDNGDYWVEVLWAGPGRDDCFNVAFVRKESAGGAGVRLPNPVSVSLDQSWSAYANNPLGKQFEQNLISDLKRYLKEKLPEYMVPGFLVFLPELPLTPNGKVDRRALPQPEAGLTVTEYEAPRGETEEKLVKIWQEVLDLKKIGVRDNFFDLGGHSLLATKVMYRLPEVFGIELPLGVLFEEPTVAGLAGRIGNGREQEEPLLALRPGLAARTGPIPLSFAQQRLWFVAQLEPETSNYHVSFSAELCGPLDTRGLEACLNEIVKRHEALRTRFETVEEMPVQILEPFEAFGVETVDLSGEAEESRESAYTQRARDLATERFDLEKGPLYRLVLYRLSDELHRLVVVMHHIVTDGWSLEIFWNELTTLYGAVVQGEKIETKLPPLPVQYADFAVWQREWMRGGVMESQVAYWKERLAGAPTCLNLPWDHPRPVLKSGRGGHENVELSVETTGKLRELNRQTGSTMFMTALAAFQVLLHRLSGEEDILVGTLVSGRNRIETEKMIGFFVNTLVMRADFSEDRVFRKHLERVKATATDVFSRQDLPFEQLVEEIQPERTLSHHPLFQVMFALHNLEVRAKDVEGLKFQIAGVPVDSAKFDLNVNLFEGEDRITGNIAYSADLFERETIRRWMGHFKCILDAVAGDPDMLLSEVPLVSEEDAGRIVESWNATRKDYGDEGLLHGLFERQAGKSPDATAVVFEERRMSYRELNEQANRLAHRLRGLGVGPETRVAICMERCPEMLVAVLGVMKAGGAYLPIDPDTPMERRRYIMENSGASLMVGSEAAAAEQGYFGKVLDPGGEEIENESTQNPARISGPRNLAYIIYTSGSTGQPKGVMLEHRSIVNHIGWICEDVADKGEVLHSAVFTSFSFDLAHTSLFGPLAMGGSVRLCRAGAEVDELMREVLSDEAINLIKVTPTHLRVMEGMDTGKSRIRKIVSGGEELPAWVARKTVEAFRTQPVVINEYGPTETAVAVTWHTFDPSQEEKIVSIGGPIPNARVYVLDEEMRPVPEGVTGELYVGGVCVGRGYWDQPGVTAEKFVPDPFGGEAGGRLYRTGDLGRWKHGGIEFLGRKDLQVKVRGYRIELGEVENALKSHPGIEEALVLIWENGDGEKQLVSYFVPKNGETVSLEEVNRYLARRIPDYMMPAYVMHLEAIPLTSNGKLDRRALPVPAVDRSEMEKVCVAPRNEIEEKVAGVWREVLRLEQVGVHDNYFVVGGNSLSAVRTVSRLKELFERQILVRDLFENATVAELSKMIEEKEKSEDPETKRIPIRRRSRGAARVRLSSLNQD